MKVLTVVGARPQFVKAFVVSRALAAVPGMQEVLIHTGQHYDREMSDVFFQELGLRQPDVQLGIGSGSHGAQTGAMLARLDELTQAEQPDLVLVYGDTNSTLAGALAAAKLHVPVAHVEAGLRSFRRDMPEEINRVMADHVSDMLFAPTHTAVENLAREGISEGVQLVGDVMYDAVLLMRGAAANQSRVLDELGLQPGAYALATVHRAANTDDPVRLSQIVDGLGRLGAPVVFPLHPRTRAALAAARLGEDELPRNVRLVPPVGYLDMLSLEQHARRILTDSGGVQKEAYFLAVPCITLREETEWLETLVDNWNVLVGTDPMAIERAWRAAPPAGTPPPAFGQGDAGQRIATALAVRASMSVLEPAR